MKFGEIAHPKKVGFYVPPKKKSDEGVNTEVKDIESNNVFKFEKFIFDPFITVHPKRFGLL